MTVTISIGIAVLGVHGDDLFELLAAADLALYRAKDAGRDQVCVYSPDGPSHAPGSDDFHAGRNRGEIQPPHGRDADPRRHA
jgi:c-di-AMP phosphodiesterase-like protein